MVPKGVRYGGRQKGTPNKATVLKVKAAKKAGAQGLTPLDYMLKVMRNPKAAEARRDWAAAASAPYIHPKLATLQSNVNLTGRTLEDLVELSMPAPANANAAGLVIEGDAKEDEAQRRKIDVDAGIVSGLASIS